LRGIIVGSLISAGFGLVYVLVNSGSLPGPVAAGLRVLAAAVFVAVLVGLFHAARTLRVVEPGQERLGRAYWVVVGIEGIALLVGARLLAGPLDTPEAGVAWVSFVVGVHFFALAVVFSESFFHWLGAAIAVCGAAGLVLAVADADEAAIDLVSGVTPGAILLAAACLGVRRLHHRSRSDAPAPRSGSMPHAPAR
jgi:uncharacterized membrane protein YhaH (DUF805 family)